MLLSEIVIKKTFTIKVIKKETKVIFFILLFKNDEIYFVFLIIVLDIFLIKFNYSLE